MQIAELEDELANTAQRDVLSSHLSLVNQKIQAKAKALKLEHRNDPIRLDPQALTLIADTRRGPTKMSQIVGEALDLRDQSRSHWSVVAVSSGIPQHPGSPRTHPSPGAA